MFLQILIGESLYKDFGAVLRGWKLKPAAMGRHREETCEVEAWVGTRKTHCLAVGRGQ